jgi:hypothetical protein
MDRGSKNMKRIDPHNLIGTNLKPENFQKNFLETEWRLNLTILIQYISRHYRTKICIEKK